MRPSDSQLREENQSIWDDFLKSVTFAWRRAWTVGLQRVRSEFRRFGSGVLGRIGGAVEVGGTVADSGELREGGGVVSGKGKSWGLMRGYWWG